MVQPEIDFGCADISYRWASEKGATLVFLMHKPQAGVRSFIITFDVYVVLNIFEKYDNKRPDPICPVCPVHMPCDPICPAFRSLDAAKARRLLPQSLGCNGTSRINDAARVFHMQEVL